MSSRLLSVWDGDEPSMHTAVDDLESFLWVLVWTLVYIMKKFRTTRNFTVDQLAERFSSHSITQIMARDSAIERRWKDVVFRGLILEWLAISREAAKSVEQHIATVFAAGDDVGLQHGAFNRLEEYSKTVYVEFIRAGHKHLENIGHYADWKAVVEASPTWLK